MADRTIQIIVEINDATGGALGNIQKGLLAMDKVVTRMQNKLRAFAIQKYAATVRLIDRVTQPGSRINSFLKSLASKVYNITMRVTDSAGSKIRQIEASLMKLAGRAWTIAINVRDNIKGKLTGLADGLLMGAGTMGVGMLGTAGIGYSAVNAAQSYMNFEQQMSRVQAVANLDKHDDKMIQLVEKAKEMGATTEWTRAEAAQAEYYMAMAGWSPDKILAALPSVMHLASAGGTDLATTSDILTDSMTGFRLNAGERYVDAAGRNVEASQHYADMMAKLVTSSNTNIAQLGEALKYSAPVVGAMFSDKDIQTRMHATEDAMVMAGLMANAGIKGSMAGTATRSIFSRFGSENRNAYNALRALNVDFTGENGEVRRIADVMKDVSARFKQGVDPNQLLDFAEAISGEKIHADTRRKLDSFIANTQKNGGKMTGADMLKMSSMLAGQEAMSGLLSVLLGDWDELAAKIEDAHGAAEKMANVQLDNLSGDLKILGSAWDAFQQSFFEGSAGDGLRAFVQSLTEIVSRAQKLFSDGIGFGDIGNVIADVIDRLKNKFLELDGIGSLLAGGALMAGLAKIGSLAQKTIGYFRTLKGLEIGQRLGGGTPPATGGRPPVGLGGGQSVGTMHVTAGVVNVNGKIAGGIGGRRVGDQTIIDRYNRERERIRGNGTPPPPPAPSRLSTMRGAAAGGAAFAAIFGALDVFNSKAISRERAQEAAAQLAAAQKEYRELLAQGVSQAELGEQTKKIAELQAAQIQVAKENAANERQVAAGATGAVLGTAMGAALGSLIGPMGTMLGGIVGGLIGEKLGTTAAEIVTPANQTAEPVKVSTDMIQKQVARQLGTEQPKKPQGAFEDIKMTSPKGIAPWLTQRDANYFGYNGEDLLSQGNGRKREPPTPWQNMPELKRGYGHGKSANVDRLSEFEAETAQLQAAAAQRQQARWLQSDGRWHGQTFQQQFDATQAGKAALESTTPLFKAQSQPPTFAPKPTAGTWQGQNQYFSPQEQARKLNEANAATGDLTSAFQKLGNWVDGFFFSKGTAEAAELNPEQLAQQAAMERGLPPESVTPESATPEISSAETPFFDFEQILSDASTFAEGVGEIFSGLGESISENLTAAFEGVGEIFSGLGESITENLSSAFEGVGEIFSGFGETISENLSSAFDVANEMFSGFSEMASSSLTTAQSAVESALSTIGATFESTRTSIQSAWGELPGFFSGVFSGLGGAAEAAGSAIYSGLTSVIGAVIGAWQGAASTISGIISSIASMASRATSLIPSVGGGGGGGAFAEGGFVNSPTQALVGEAGAEVIIPLSSSRRSRAMDLFEKTARILGGDAMNFGGDELQTDLPLPDFDDSTSLPMSNFQGLSAENSPAPSTQNTSANEISMGGIHVTFNISGENPQEIMQAIKENLAEVADNVAGRLADTIHNTHNNQLLEG